MAIPQHICAFADVHQFSATPANYRLPSAMPCTDAGGVDGLCFSAAGTVILSNGQCEACFDVTDPELYAELRPRACAQLGIRVLIAGEIEANDMILASVAGRVRLMFWRGSYGVEGIEDVDPTPLTVADWVLGPVTLMSSKNNCG